jgi:lactoylglutathione lyase
LNNHQVISSRSTELAIDKQITFFYYKDLPKAVAFYQNIMGFELVVDQGFCKIFRTVGDALFGVVD